MENILSVGKAAKLIGVTVHTMQRWDREGRLIPASRSATNRRVYTESQILEFMGIRKNPTKERKIIAYCRVSSASQKPDLKNQRNILEEFCSARGIANVEFVEEVGGGLNFKRKKFVSLMDEIGDSKVGNLIVAHKDRLVRFGYDWFEHYASRNGCTITLLNQERLSPEQEMVQDLMSIIHCFSSRLYGLRDYRKTLSKALAEDK